MPATQERIEQDGVGKLAGDVRGHSPRVQVRVEDHHVTVTGTVPTRAAHRRVIRDVWALPSVSAIVDKLVLGWSPGEGHRDSGIELDLSCEPSAKSNVIDPDQAISERITKALAQTDCFELDPCAIEVVVNNGTVTLEGIVPSWEAVRAALSAARKTPGVVRLRNAILLGP